MSSIPNSLNNSGITILRVSDNSTINNTYVIGNYDKPVPNNRILITTYRIILIKAYTM
jgi:hypothetical protein